MYDNAMKKQIIFILILVMTAGALSGCATVRRKFVRKKQANDEPELYLDLREYAQAPAEEIYHQYYVFAHGWIEELVQLLDTGSNKKRMRYSIEQAISNFARLKEYIPSEKISDYRYLSDDLASLRKKVFNNTIVESRRDTLLRDARNIERDLEKKFSSFGGAG